MKGIWVIIARRLIRLIPTMFGVAFIVFMLMHLAPRDPIELMIGEAGHVTKEEIEALRREYGLDKPLHEQFAAFLLNALRGDFGRSFSEQQPVISLIKSRLPATVELSLASFLIAVVISIPLGVLSAVYRDSIFDRIVTLLSLGGISFPSFYLGLILILIFGVGLEVLPISGRSTFGAEPHRITGLYLLDSLITLDVRALLSSIRHLILPAITLGGIAVAVTVRMIRANMLEVLEQDYIRTARAKGLPEWKVVMKHALKNALIPTVSVLGLQIGVLLSGNMIVETVFSWPGLGSLAVNGIYARDYPLVQGIVMVYAATYVLVNLAVDILYIWLNPRVEVT
ncbi:TPA: ABC transporter permease [Candidatus Poribacteria bacterium]|nr:ABC transporter permease [Candidatus Poribacteria bacterium]HEX29213.1 ABC transporter permease [Candidatus Poribacteria bacterium]